MALYRLEAKVIGRTGGRSATASAAYRAAERIADLRTGLVYDYARRSGVAHTEILAPETAPAWVQDRACLWNAVEAAEARKNSQLAREFTLSLPRELSHEQRVAVVRSFVSAELVSRGMVADIAHHTGRTASDGQPQPHAHVMVTLRRIGPDGFTGNKAREWNAVELLESWRERWAANLNQALEQAQVLARVDHRSLEARRAEAQQMAEQAHANGHEAWAEAFELQAVELDRQPEPKLGAAAAMEARGIASDQGKAVRAIRAERAERRSLVQELRGWLAERARAVADRAQAFTEGLRERLAGLTSADLGVLREANLAVALARTGRGQAELLSEQERAQIEEHRQVEAAYARLTPSGPPMKRKPEQQRASPTPTSGPGSRSR